MTSLDNIARMQNNREVCELKHSALRKEFYAELLDENPDCLCEQCDGYNYNCDCYEPKRRR